MYDPKDPAQSAAVKHAVQMMITRALEMEGTVSGEHAIGIGKKVSSFRLFLIHL
jgi:D-lactate dehydrogenase (cytochrome)